MQILCSKVLNTPIMCDIAYNKQSLHLKYNLTLQLVLHHQY